MNALQVDLGQEFLTLQTDYVKEFYCNWCQKVPKPQPWPETARVLQISTGKVPNVDHISLYLRFEEEFEVFKFCQHATELH